MNFLPYTPPNAGNGPLTIDKDLCERVNGDGDNRVTPAVVQVVAWMLTHGRLNKKEQAQLLDGLGLEIAENRFGGSVVQPKGGQVSITTKKVFGPTPSKKEQP